MSSEMNTVTRVQIASAAGIVLGLLIQIEKDVRLTPKGMSYAEDLWSRFSDLDKLMLAGYLKKAIPDA